MSSPLSLSCTDYASFKAAITQFSVQSQFVEVFYRKFQTVGPSSYLQNFSATAIDYKARISYELQTLTAVTDPTPSTFATDFPSAVNQSSGAIQSYSL